MNIKLFLIYLVGLVFFLIGCQPSNQPLTQAEKEEIVSTVNVIHSQLVQAINENDADKITSFFLKDEDFKSLFNGNVTIGWEKFSDNVHKWYNANTIKMLKIEKHYVDVLSRDIVIMTNQGLLTGTDGLGNEINSKNAWNGLFIRQPNIDEWKILIGHESSEKPY